MPYLSEFYEDYSQLRRPQNFTLRVTDSCIGFADFGFVLNGNRLVTNIDRSEQEILDSNQ